MTEISWEMKMLEHPGIDVAHVRYDHGTYGWQAMTYLCTSGGTALIEKACCPVRKRKSQAMADAKALGLPIK